MRRVAAMLRAVNVGGAGKVAMAELNALLAAEGFEEPQTLLASGNAVFATTLRGPEVEARVEAALKARLGLATGVFVREHDELAAVMAGNPFAEFAREQPSRMMVAFLKGEPPDDLSDMARWATQGERFAAGPRCIYVCYPAGSGVSKLANAKTAASRGTSRNWNTVGKLMAATDNR